MTSLSPANNNSIEYSPEHHDGFRLHFPSSQRRDRFTFSGSDDGLPALVLHDPSPRRRPPATEDPVKDLVICGFNAAFALKGLKEVTSESVTAAGAPRQLATLKTLACLPYDLFSSSSQSRPSFLLHELLSP